MQVASEVVGGWRRGKIGVSANHGLWVPAGFQAWAS
jgi:hypothetical protein